VALNLAVERHLLARPSLATEMHKQKEKEKHAPNNKKHEHQTSTSALQMLNPYVDKNVACSGGKKNKLAAQV
jgi:hypothetical protein